ncbi:MAG: IS1595 family transposase [Acidobacteriota bacterium]|nr:IS1595 family transposase [Acidobacteriota bacterium]
MKPLSIVQLLELVPDDAAAERLFAKSRWPDGPVCPHCDSKNVQTGAKHPSQPYRCRTCRKRFSVKTGTMMAESKLGYRVWVMAWHLILNHPKGVSSLQLAKDLGISRKTAWFLGHRIRETFSESPEAMTGTVEVDETYIGGLEKNKHWRKKQKKGRGTVGKFPVLGVRERETGRFAAKVSLNTTKTALEGFIGRRVARRSLVYTDDHGSYSGLVERYDHGIIRHSRKEYVRGDCHTNGIESLWATFKRAYKGTYHWMSLKHLQRYVDECTGRLNLRGLGTLEQLAAMVQAMEGKRLTFRELVDNG